LIDYRLALENIFGGGLTGLIVYFPVSQGAAGPTAQRFGQFQTRRFVAAELTLESEVCDDTIGSAGVHKR
jgi:hypothetical protein